MVKKLLVCVGLIAAFHSCGDPGLSMAANELNVNITENYTKGGDQDNIVAPQSINVLGTARSSTVIMVAPNTTNLVNVSGISTAGYAYVRNISPTNTAGTVLASTDGTNALVQIDPGDPDGFRMHGLQMLLTTTSNATHTVVVDIKSK